MKDIMILKNDRDEEVEVEILFTYTSKDTNQKYIVYTDQSKDSDGKIKVYAGIMDEENKILNPVVNSDDYNIIESILSSIESSN